MKEKGHNLIEMRHNFKEKGLNMREIRKHGHQLVKLSNHGKMKD